MDKRQAHGIDLSVRMQCLMRILLRDTIHMLSVVLSSIVMAASVPLFDCKPLSLNAI